MANAYNKQEFAGAFGDLGTLIPFLVAYIIIAELNPVNILFVFGLVSIVLGLYYKTPIPVQPMKAIGAAVIISPSLAKTAIIFAAGISTAIIWLILGVTNTITYIVKIVEKPVIRGIMLGLGISFIRNGVIMMQENFYIAFITLALGFFF